MKAAIFMEIDFAAKRKQVCSLCDKPFMEHFQPPADANMRLAANWCPNPFGGFTSMTFRKPKIEQKEQQG